MMQRYVKFQVCQFVLLLVFLLVPTGACPAQEESPAVELATMSFNLRYGTANDGENRWDLRRENVLTTIEECQPDVLGIQEALDFQANYLRENLEGYSYFGRSRENRVEGEQCGILFKAERFDQLEAGHFWLSETPNRPGSKSWDSSLPRMASWVKLFDRESQHVFYFLNTHFDHRGAAAREESAKLIVARTRQFEAGIPVIVTGDFNTGPGSAPHQVLVAAFTDTFASQHTDLKDTGTFGGFAGKRSGPRIDFIFATEELSIIDAKINHRNFEGRDPSDHFPVTSKFRFRNESN